MAKQVLSKAIKPYQLVTFFVGTIIGAGWMIVVGDWLDTAGIIGASAAFAICAAGISLIALCYLELGLRYPQSGGEIIYLYEAFGAPAAFIVGWLLIFILVSWSGFQAVTFGWLCTLLLPELTGPKLYTIAGYDLYAGSILIGIAGTVWLTWVNVRGGGTAAKFQEVVTTVLFLGCVLICATAAFGGDLGRLDNPFALEINHWWGGVLSVLATAPIWFAGFNLVIQAFGELTDTMRPHRIVFFILASMVGVLLFYVVILVSVGIGSSSDERAEQDFAVFAALPDNIFVQRFVLFIGLLGIVTGWNAVLFGAARILFALGRSRIISPVFGGVHETFGSPAFAVLFSSIVGSVAIFIGRNALNIIINSTSAIFLLIYILACVSMMKLRAKDNASLPFRVPLFPFLPGVALLFSISIFATAIFLQWTTRSGPVPSEWIVVAAWSALGFAIWHIARPARRSISELERSMLIHLR